MINLKPYQDAVIEAEAEVQRIASEIDAQFCLGTEEGKAEALAKQPELEAAQKKYEKAVSFYESMSKTNRPNDIAKNFIPVTETSPDPDGGQPKTIKRDAYETLSPIDRAKFIREGGTIED